MLDILAELRSIEGGAQEFTYDFDDYKERLSIDAAESYIATSGKEVPKEGWDQQKSHF